MTQYLLSVHGSAQSVAAASAMTPTDQQAVYAAVDGFNSRLQDDGAWVFAGGLAPVQTAVVVDAAATQPPGADGPVDPGSTWLGGFWVIEAADLDAALAWAEQGSRACAAPVEVRAFQGP